MKKFTKNPGLTKAAWLVSCIVLLSLFAGCKKGNETPQLSITTVATNLAGPMGIEVDHRGNLWVSESGTFNKDGSGKMGTHNDDGKVVMITPNGKKYDAITHLQSYMNVHSGELQGTVHILLDGGMLYILSGDNLYKANISRWKPGNQPLDARDLPYEDIGGVISQVPSSSNPDHDSHPYNLTKGPNGDLYITDAGANAILRRKGPNNYSILAGLSPISNPAFPGLGGPTVQPVPTSIMFDGRNFLVTTLTGFPFPQGQAVIYKVSTSGQVSVYQKGFTMLVDQAEGYLDNHIVVQHASSFNPASGFALNSGALLWVNGSTSTLLAGGLNQPVGIKKANAYTWYVTCLGDGTVLKVTYH
jgi:hypothetical protein